VGETVHERGGRSAENHTYTRPKSARSPPEVRKVAHGLGRPEIGQVRRVIADMHVAPAWRRWTARIALAVGVAAAIAIAPTMIDRGDERADKLRAQLRDTEAKIDALDRANAAVLDDIHGLRSEVGAIERRARDELGMVYPGELVIQIDERGAKR
jgi:cell division protein FtsB